MYDEGGWIFILSGKKMQIIIRRKNSIEKKEVELVQKDEIMKNLKVHNENGA